MLQRAVSAVGGGGQFQKVTLTADEFKTITLPFEVKTIVYADAVQTSSGYSGFWSSNLNFSSHSNFWFSKNDMTGLGSTAVADVGGNRLRSISADGKTIKVYAGAGTGGTTFWLYGDEE